MDNRELYLKFIEVASYNPFDAYVQLKAYNKEYKKSDFYKQTKMPLLKAYKMFLTMLPSQLYFKLSELTDTEMLAAKITSLIDSIDENSVDNLLNKITNIFNIEKLQDEKGDLKILLNQVKDLVK